MISNKHYDIQKLYRLPFSRNDNFNGWIEVTTFCNKKCPGCYRACDREDHKGEHKPFEEVKQEILDLARIRNCSMISISGGEALLHPQILRIISFIREQKINPVLFTNGVLLDRDLLATMKKAGLVGIVIRVDSLQSREKVSDEVQLNRVRADFAELCEGSDLFLTFTSCIDQSNLNQIKDIINWAQENSRRVGQLILITKRQLVFTPDDILPDKSFVFADQLIGQIRQDLPELAFSAYLGSQSEAHSPKWLQAFRYVLKGRVLGYADPKFVELLQMLYHFRTGRYLGILKKKKNFVSFLDLLLLSLFNKGMRRICGAFLRNAFFRPYLFFSKAAVQGLTVVIPPHFVGGRRDLCDSCPDAILYKGELVPSCALEEVIRFGHPFEFPDGAAK